MSARSTKAVSVKTSELITVWLFKISVTTNSFNEVACRHHEDVFAMFQLVKLG